MIRFTIRPSIKFSLFFYFWRGGGDQGPVDDLSRKYTTGSSNARGIFFAEGQEDRSQRLSDR